MDWNVRYIDYLQQYAKLRSELLETIDCVLSRGDVMLRQQLRDFEAHLAEFVGTRYAVGLSNCTDAMHLTLRALGIGPGDEVITVSHTFVATAAAVHHSGATPVLVDIQDDHTIDPAQVAAAITPRTRAIMPVHLNGRLCDMNAIMTLAEQHRLLVIEDAAQALGGAYQGIRGGNWGVGGCFSFYPAKLLGAYGDAGALVTNDETLAQKVRMLRDHGRMPNGDLAGWSFNCRMDNLHAAMLDVKLRYVPDWIARRREIATRYHAQLADLPQLLLPPPPGNGTSFDVFQNYEIEADNRDGLRGYLREQRIETLLPWGGRGIHQFPALGLTHYHLPRTELLFARALMLPMHCELTDAQVDYTADAIRQFYRTI